MYVIERGSGKPIVLIHGFGIDHRALLPLDPVFERSGGWRRIYLDLPGMGRSPIGDVASSEDMVAAVTAEIQDRLGEERFALVGNSYGGMIARRIAHDLRSRVLGLAALAAVFAGEPSRRDLPERVVLRRDADVLAELGEAAESYAEYAVVMAPDNARSFANAIFPALQAADGAGLARIEQRYAFDVEPEDDDAVPFDRPCLFVAGRQDHVTGYRNAWVRIEHYPRATFAVLDAAGHNVGLEREGTMAALVADWLERVRL